MKSKLLLVILLITCNALPISSFAQLSEPFSSPEQSAPPPPPDPVDTPIDGGLSILIGAGVVYGIKKARDQRKKR